MRLKPSNKRKQFVWVFAVLSWFFQETVHDFGCRNRFGSSHKCDNNGKCRQWKHVLIHITRQTRQTCAQIFMSIERKLTSHVSMTHVIKTGFSFKHFVNLKFSSHIHTHPAIWIFNQIVLFKPFFGNFHRESLRSTAQHRWRELDRTITTPQHDGFTNHKRGKILYIPWRFVSCWADTGFGLALWVGRVLAGVYTYVTCTC